MGREGINGEGECRQFFQEVFKFLRKRREGLVAEQACVVEEGIQVEVKLERLHYV